MQQENPEKLEPLGIQIGWSSRREGSNRCIRVGWGSRRSRSVRSSRLPRQQAWPSGLRVVSVGLVGAVITSLVWRVAGWLKVEQVCAGGRKEISLSNWNLQRRVGAHARAAGAGAKLSGRSARLPVESEKSEVWRVA